jgi:hypothetical protein
LEALTEKLGVHALLEDVEQQIRNMPDGYRKKFRYIMHRDIRERLLMYKEVGRHRVNRTCDPRFIATSLEPAK